MSRRAGGAVGVVAVSRRRCNGVEGRIKRREGETGDDERAGDDALVDGSQLANSFSSGFGRVLVRKRLLTYWNKTFLFRRVLHLS